MTQRKLTDEELSDVRLSLWHLRQVAGFALHPVYVGCVISDLDSMATNGTTDGQPWREPEVEGKPESEPVIDDKWAAVWPRRWVMCRERDSRPWAGPFRLGMVNDEGYRFMVFDKYDTRTAFTHARPATAEEIATVEPPAPSESAKPQIGEGYREATEADSPRRDLQKWNPYSRCWEPGFIVGTDTTYRVPVDRIPTDEDAKQRPTVMVRDVDLQEWRPRTLVAVCPQDSLHFVIASERGVTKWKQARFPYPGELDQ